MAVTTVTRAQAEQIVLDNPGQVVISKSPSGVEYELTVIPRPVNRRERRTSVGGNVYGGADVVYRYVGKKKGELDGLMGELIPTPNEATAKDATEEDGESPAVSKKAQEKEDEETRKAALEEKVA